MTWYSLTTMRQDPLADTPVSARLLVARALGQAATMFPHLDPAPLATAGLAPRDARLATAIHRAAMHHWLTAEFLLDRFLRLPCRRLQPELRGVLLSGAVQLLFFERLPTYAVVDESVDLARELVRKNARGLVNAVLRKLANAIAGRDPQMPWRPAAHCLPCGTGTLFLGQPLLPDPKTQLAKYLSVATSHPSCLVERWLELFGPHTTIELCQHGTQNPPIIVALEPGFSFNPLTDPAARNGSTEQAPQDGSFVHHHQPGFVVWQGDHEKLAAFLAEHPARRVQDPASARPIGLAQGLSPQTIVDLCAGRGTKTRQLAMMFPQARIVASDVNVQRTDDLEEVARRFPQVEFLKPENLDSALGDKKADLLVLDVPCSNTAVLSRRPEARYRFRPRSLQSLVALQQEIIRRGLSLLGPHGHLLYATCSLDPAENQQQVQSLVLEHGFTLICQEHQLPQGCHAHHHDGFYAALLAR